MASIQFPVKFSVISAVLAFGIVASPLLSPRLRAEQIHTASNSQKALVDLVSVDFQPPSRGAPPVTAGGGSRGCSQASLAGKDATALIPSGFQALTVEKSPTFLLYVPQSSPPLEFKLQNKQTKEVAYATAISIPKQSGIVQVRLPNDVKLSAGEMYDWHLISICDASDRTGDAVISGSIERLDAASLQLDSGLTLEEALKNASASPVEQFSLYAKEGIWQDALATLAKIRQTAPEDPTVAKSWEKLLDMGAFHQFSGEEFVEIGES